MAKKGAVSVSGEEKLVEINFEPPVSDIVKGLCKKWKLEEDLYTYGLKLVCNKTNKEQFGNYITDDNKHILENGFHLQLVYSPDTMVDRIFRNLTEDRRQCFKDLYDLSTDPAFIKSLVSKGKYEQLLWLLCQEELSGFEASACFILLLHLLKHQVISDLHQDHLTYLLHFINDDTNVDEIHLAYAVLSQILYQKMPTFAKHKEEIIKRVTITNLLKKLNFYKTTNELETNTLQLINAIIKSLKRESRASLIKEINTALCRGVIHNRILSKPNICYTTAHELYVYQTFLLSIHRNSLKCYHSIDHEIVKDLIGDNTVQSRGSVYMEFQNNHIAKRSQSLHTILDHDDNRLSMASMRSAQSPESSYYNDDEMDGSKISLLACECLQHFKTYYGNNFYQSKAEEEQLQPGFLESSERLTKLLAKIFKIGKEPDKSTVIYQPLVFNPEFRHDFFPELFARVMWLLSKTRREMKASTKDDYEKVLKILKKQVELTLNEKPKCYNILIERFKFYNYARVSKELEKEYKAETTKLLRTHPCIQEIRKPFEESNRELIYKRHVYKLKQGSKFRKLPLEKKRNQYIFVRLSNNERLISWGDYENESKTYNLTKSISVENIKHIVVGKNCQHVKDGSVKMNLCNQAFSIILEDDRYNFFADSEKEVTQWKEGINILIGKDDTPETKKDLEMLTEMDCLLQLIELQNIPIPSKPPPIPKLPENCKPNIPPRPAKLMEKLAEAQRKKSEIYVQIRNENGDSKT